MEVLSKVTQQSQEASEPMDLFTLGQTTFLADGPLARAYSDALDVLYRKETGPDGLVLESQDVALETQALDEIETKQNWLAAQATSDMLEGDGAVDAGMLYGVKQQQLKYKDLINVVDAIGRMSPQQKLYSAVVIDVSSADDTSVQCTPSPIQAALESYCKTHQVAVYSSLNEFLKRHG